MVLSKTKLVYNGKTQKPTLKVTDGSAIKKGSDYYAYWQPSSSKKAGTYTVLVEGVGNCCGTVELTYKILKANNPLDVKGKTASVERKNLKKEIQTLKVTKVVKFLEEGKGTMSYKLISAKKGSKSFKKYFKMAKQTGKVTIKKNKKMGKGTYKVKVKVRALGNGNYKPSTWKTVTFKVKVK